MMDAVCFFGDLMWGILFSDHSIGVNTACLSKAVDEEDATVWWTKASGDQFDNNHNNVVSFYWKKKQWLYKWNYDYDYD